MFIFVKGDIAMARKGIGIFFLIIAIGGLYGSFAAPQKIDAIGAGVGVAIYLVIGLVLLFKKGKTEEEKAALKAQREEAKERSRRMLITEHMAGLPLAQAVTCTVSFGDAGIAICNSGNMFNLNYGEITGMDIKTSVEIQKVYVSSAGGAIAGAILFGPLRAMAMKLIQQYKPRIARQGSVTEL